jgi:hypothetical protein
MRKLIEVIRSLDRRKLLETWKITFGIMGSAGYAGEIAGMKNLFLAAVSVVLLLGTGAAVYSMLERSN